jgi:hypothetical protein
MQVQPNDALSVQTRAVAADALILEVRDLLQEADDLLRKWQERQIAES